jgi:hypothetical protein
LLSEFFRTALTSSNLLPTQIKDRALALVNATRKAAGFLEKLFERIGQAGPGGLALLEQELLNRPAASEPPINPV